MEQPTRDGIFQAAAKRLRQDFEELRTVPHAALRGGEAEELVRRFLREHLPRRFDVTSGFIIDPRDKVSRQTDVIVYDALNCPVYRASDTAAILPSNNVAAVVEVKSRLDGAQLEDALDKIASVKALSKVKTPDGVLATDQTHGSVFAFESAISLETLADHYAGWIYRRGLGHHADVVCVLDRGIVVTVADPPDRRGWALIFLEGFGGEKGEGMHIGLGIHQLDTATLDAYFRILLGILTLFRSMTDHPGYAWGNKLPQGGMFKLKYLTSLTTERDPVKRHEKLERYAAMVREDMAKRPVPPDWPSE